MLPLLLYQTLNRRPLDLSREETRVPDQLMDNPNLRKQNELMRLVRFDPGAHSSSFPAAHLAGRHHRLEYHEDGTVGLAVKLQELFGLAETPRIGRRREPVVLSLLAPNGRPVQVTRDLRSFWDRTYPEVRKELRGRYPKHPWPEDPWRASPSSKLKPKR